MVVDDYWHVGIDLDIQEQNDIYSSEKELTEVENPDFILVSFILKHRKMIQLTIPASPVGKYTFDDKVNSKIKTAISIQAYKGNWCLCSIKPVYICDENGYHYNRIELQDQQKLTIKNIDEDGYIIVEYLREESATSHNYRILENKITIGGYEHCDIAYQSKLSEKIEVELLYSSDHWKLINDDNNDILINGVRKTQSTIDTGDVLFLMGLKVIAGIGFLSINDGNQRVSVNREKLLLIDKTTDVIHFDPSINEHPDVGYFNRLPRRRMPMPEREIRFDSPPMSLNDNQIPLILRMGGSMIMGTSSMLAGHPTMMISSVLFPILNSRYSQKQKKEYEERRVKKYTEYLEKKRQEIEDERQHEEHVLNNNYPDLNKVLTFTKDGRRLWERRKQDDDFLNIRLGYGNIPLYAKYSYNEERFSLEEDPLEDQMYELINQQIECQDAPVMNSFLDDYFCGVLGSRNLSITFVKRLVMQIAVTHSYDEVKLVFLIDENDLAELEFIKYLPHCWNDEKSFRLLATNTGEAYQLSRYLRDEIGENLEDEQKNSLKLEDILRNRAYYIVFALEKKLLDSVEVFKELLQLENNVGVSIITVFDDLPKECSKIFHMSSSGDHRITFLKEPDKEDVCFKLDRYEENLADYSMKKLFNTFLKIDSENATLPKMITFLEMFGVGKIEHLNCARRWKENNPVRSLATPIGVASDGNPFVLDLHQKYHGPHGLIAGMTGSGKSEFIITYILSMAVNYRPDEVAFVLIDYKGGGLTSAFEDPVREIYLPHLAGTITNLDGAAINRSLISIQSEMTRRQRLFREAKGYVEESTVDIYSYQKLYREGLVREPLPHLLIIADEFAEMKQQEPEFMDSLISIARIGRSLGVHLILATQKPSGVVNDQIRSNTRFRICLKVQDRSDSIDMLKRPEGAEIKETGRFYLQVGYNELFALGQSAWTGADYEPQDELLIQRDDSVEFLDILGQKMHEEKPAVIKSSTGKSQLSEIVSYLSELAESENIERKVLWSDPLPKLIDCQSSDSKESGSENGILVYLGQIDDPANQRQFSYVYDFMECKNMLIVGAGKSGKTSLIQSMLLQLTKNYGPEDVNYYVLDYSSHLLKVFDKMPHCGAVLSEDEPDLVKQLFTLIDTIAEDRRKAFHDLEVDNFKSARTKKRMPLIIVFIDSITGMLDNRETEMINTNLNAVLKKAINFGIYFVISCSHLNETTSRLRQEIGDKIAFEVKDKYECQDVLGCKISYLPPALPGRGLVNMNGNSLEFQAAIFGTDLEENQRIDSLKDDLSQIKSLDPKANARRLMAIVHDEDYESFSAMFPAGRIPLGLYNSDAKQVALPLKQLKTLAIYWGNEKGIIPVYNNFLHRAFFEQMDVTVLSRKEDSVFSFESNEHVDTEFLENIHYVSCRQEDVYESIKGLLTEMGKDTVHLEHYCQEHDLVLKEALEDDQFPKQVFSYMSQRVQPKLLIIESVKDICDLDGNSIRAAINGICAVGSLYHTYILHCYMPNDGKKVKDEAIRKMLSREEMVLLFGGSYDRQGLLELAPQYNAMSNPVDYNKMLMSYRGNFYELLMPCGMMEAEEVEEGDDASIF